MTNQINTQRVERKRIDKAFPNPHEQQQQQHYTHTQWELCGNADVDWSSAAIYTGVLVFHFNIVWDVFMLDYLIHTGLQEGVRERKSGREKAFTRGCKYTASKEAAHLNW